MLNLEKVKEAKRLYKAALTAHAEMKAKENEYLDLYDESGDPATSSERRHELEDGSISLVFKAERDAREAKIKFVKAGEAEQAAMAELTESLYAFVREGGQEARP